MKLPDVNVLLYAVDEESPQHAEASRALREAYVEGQVALCWPVLVGLLRLATRSGILQSPLTVAQALSVIDRWLEHPRTMVVVPGERHADILRRLLMAAGRGGNLVTDAHLAALAIEHGAELVSFDRDFAVFEGLSWRHLA